MRNIDIIKNLKQRDVFPAFILCAICSWLPRIAVGQATVEQRSLVSPATKVALPRSAIQNASFPKLDMTQDWPWWRGPNRDGATVGKQSPPTEWDAQRNVAWKVELPGKGHGSPIVVGQHVYLPASDESSATQSVICIDRNSGQILWTRVVHRGNFVKQKMNPRSSHASGTLACDGDRLFINFLNDDAVFTSALDRTGNILWQRKITDYVIHQGYGSSPALFDDLVLVSADNKAGGALAALSRSTGEIVWKHDRPAMPNYSSPIVLRLGDRDQLVMTGCNLVSSFNPRNGQRIWEVDGATTECVTSTVTDGAHVFSSGGYPDNHVACVLADGSGKTVWRNTMRVYVPSMLHANGYLYAVADGGVAVCWKSDTGERAWQARIGGTYYASPVLVGDRIFATSLEGKTSIYRADPGKFELLAANSLGDEVFPTPTYCGNRIYMRVAHQRDDGRQETLYCLARSDER